MIFSHIYMAHHLLVSCDIYLSLSLGKLMYYNNEDNDNGNDNNSIINNIWDSLQCMQYIICNQ